MQEIQAIALTGSEVSTIQQSDLSQWTVERLDEVFTQCLTGTAQCLYLGSLIWQEKRRRGQELPKSGSALIGFLPAVAVGDLAAELLAKCQYEPLLRAMIGVPLDFQRQLASGGTVPVAIDREGNSRDFFLDDFLGQPQIIRRVFRHGHVVPPESQRFSIRSPYQRTRGGKAKKSAPALKIVRFEVGQGPYHPITKEDRNRANHIYSVVFDLLPLEEEALRDNAIRAGISVRELVRRTLHEQGLLKKAEETA